MKGLIISGVFLLVLLSGASSGCKSAAPVRPPSPTTDERAAEEVFFQATLVPVRAEVEASMGGPEGKAAPDVFSVEHPLSKFKPSMRPKRLPFDKSAPEGTQEVTLGESVYEMPIPPTAKKRAGLKMSTFNTQDYNLLITRSFLEQVDLNPPEEVLEHATLLPTQKIANSVRAAFQQLREMTEFDLLTRIMNVDANAIQPGTPIGERVANLALLGMKVCLLYAGPPQYYEAPCLRAFVDSPFDDETADLNKKGELENKTPIRRIIAYVEFRGEDRIIELWFHAEGNSIPKLTQDFVADFLSRCKLKKASAVPPPSEK